MPEEASATEERLSDRQAAQLARLLLAYFRECYSIDSSTPHPGNLTVRELVEDLASSTTGSEQREIEEHLDAMLELFQ